MDSRVLRRRASSSTPARTGRSDCLVIVPTRRAADGSRVLALPKGHPDGDETPEAGGTARGARGDRRRGRAGREARRRRATATSARGRRIAKVVRFFLFEYRSGDLADHDHEVEEARWMPLEEAARGADLHGRARDGGARRSSRTVARTGRPARSRAGAQLLLDGLRRPAQARAQDRDDPPRRQVAQVPQEPGGAGHDRLPALAAREDLRGGHRPGRGQARRATSRRATSSTTTPSSAATRR